MLVSEKYIFNVAIIIYMFLIINRIENRHIPLKNDNISKFLSLVILGLLFLYLTNYQVVHYKKLIEIDY